MFFGGLFALYHGRFKQKLAGFISFLTEHADVHGVLLIGQVIGHEDSDAGGYHEAVSGEATYAVEASGLLRFVNDGVAVRA